MKFVLDASVALSWLLRDASARDEPYAFSVLKGLRTAGAAAEVPATWGLEIANVIARCEAKGQVTRCASLMCSSMNWMSSSWGLMGQNRK